MKTAYIADAACAHTQAHQTVTPIYPFWHMQPHTVPTHSALVMAQQMTLCCFAAIYRTDKKWEWKNPISSLSLLPLSVCLSLSLLLSQEALVKVMEDVERERDRTEEEQRKPDTESTKWDREWQRVQQTQKHRDAHAQRASMQHFVLYLAILHVYFEMWMILLNPKPFLCTFFNLSINCLYLNSLNIKFIYYYYYINI